MEPEEVSHVGDINLEPEVSNHFLAPTAPGCAEIEQFGIVFAVEFILKLGKDTFLSAGPVLLCKDRVEPPASKPINNLATGCKREGD